MTVEALILAGASLFLTIAAFLIVRLLDRIEKELEEVKRNTADFKSFSVRAETILEYHEKRLDECNEFIEKVRPKHYEF